MNKIDVCNIALNNLKNGYDSIVTDETKLRQVSKDTTVDEVIRLNLINRLRKSNGLAWIAGCGLAAIQIGIPLRFAWFRWGHEEFVLLNPEIIKYSGKCKPVEEGCMSVPDKKCMVPRYYKIKYISHGVKKTARGLKAHIIQHEIDHMNGILNIDKAVSVSKHVRRK